MNFRNPTSGSECTKKTLKGQALFKTFRSFEKKVKILKFTLGQIGDKPK